MKEDITITKKMQAIDLTLLGDDAKRFVDEYIVKLNKAQKACEDDSIFYTKITMAYAATNNLHFINLTFHPLSFAKRKYYEHAKVNEVRKVLEEIILYEVNDENPKLTKEELEATIKHFRELEKKDKEEQ